MAIMVYVTMRKGLLQRIIPSAFLEFYSEVQLIV